MNHEDVYPDPVHSEPYVSPAGIAYLIEVRKGVSGEYHGCWKDQERGLSMYIYPSYKTVRGAVSSAKKQIKPHEDLLLAKEGE